ncbi:MAG: nucleotidyl transferase AbiEii/AbiGii toxin family protein [Spirochaetota bacterium]
MKDEALRIAGKITEPTARINILREYVQACILRSLHEAEAFQALSFVGGTCLRFIYNLPRFSEDLDFSLEQEPREPVSVWFSKVRRDLNFLGFEADVTLNVKKTVYVAWIGIPRLMSEARLTDIQEQRLSVKAEIDSRPPAGARFEARLVNRHTLFAIRHHDLPSLLAGKIHAICTRPYAKGRDWYDLVWYLSLRPPIFPNSELLRNAFAQTSPDLESQSWQEMIIEAAERSDFEAIRRDVNPFLERPEEARFLTREYIRTLL